MHIEQFELNLGTGVHFHSGHSNFGYSDGTEVERYILDSIRSAEDLSTFSKELKARVRDWPTEYHFSWERQNLLRHVKIPTTFSVLELGSGCGSITRQLGESGASVSAIEGSIIRAECCAQRCRDLENVKVYCGNFANIDFLEAFDLVLLIGVLEYSGQFISATDPHLKCIQIAKSALKPGGTLIVAIENQLGLKYLAGCPEDHFAIPYFGVEDRYPITGIRTFGRNVLEHKLRSAGFKNVVFQYPFPDYKLPKVIFSEEGLTSSRLNVADILAGIQKESNGAQFISSFSDRLSLPSVIDNDLAVHLANSFLVFCGDKPFPHEDMSLGHMFTANREKDYATITKFKTGHIGIEVEKSALHHHTSSSDNVIKFHCSSEEYIEGNNLDFEIDRCLAKGDLARVKLLIRLWMKEVQNGQDDGNSDVIDKNKLLASILIDATPKNFILRDSKLYAIDQEWEYGKKVEFRYLWTKYLFEKMFYDELWLKHDFGKSCFSGLSLSLGCELDQSDLDHYFNVQDEINQAVYGQNNQPNFSLGEINAVLSKQRSFREIMVDRDRAKNTIPNERKPTGFRKLYKKLKDII